jgi:hypothetical protein
MNIEDLGTICAIKFEDEGYVKQILQYKPRRIRDAGSPLRVG